MTKQDKFIEIIVFLRKLKEYQFDYSSYVSKFNDENQCGTVCCVVGWFPAIFKDKSPMQWDDLNNGNTFAIYEGLESFLEITEDEISALFYGNTWLQGKLELPLTSQNSNLPKVIALFEAYYDAYVKGKVR